MDKVDRTAYGLSRNRICEVPPNNRICEIGNRTYVTAVLTGLFISSPALSMMLSIWGKNKE